MQKQKSTKRSPASPLTTQVNPKGLAKVYLRTPEIFDFFSAQRAYYLNLKTQHAQSRKHWLITTSVVGTIIALLLFNEFGFGDDEGVIVIFWSIAVIIALVTMGITFSGKLNQAKLQEAKGQMLNTFFTSIAHDLHPDSGLKGTIDHGKPQVEDIYKRKTSPYSGSKKVYYKFAWANLKFMLIDGTTLRLRCTDKSKEKAGTTVRFQEIGKARIMPNTIIYDLLPGQHFNLRKDLCASEADLIQHAPAYGLSLAKMLKEGYRSKLHRRATPLAPTSQKPQAKRNGDLNKIQGLLDRSGQAFKTERLGEKVLELRYVKDQKEHLLWLDVQVCDTEKRLGIRLPLLGDSPAPLRLLRANPSLAHGRFAYIKQKNAGTPQLCLLSLLEWATLDANTLTTSIQGLCQMGSHLTNKNLPDKTKAHRSERALDQEQALLHSIAAGLPLVSALEHADTKAKFRIQLPQDRQQTVHIRFDRQDISGKPLISLLSYCGANNAELYELALEENAHYSDGALGIDTLGEKQMFVVYENLLASSANASQLIQTILQVAQKADHMEALLSSTDNH